MPCLQHLPNLPKLVNECRSILVSERDVLIKELHLLCDHVLIELERVQVVVLIVFFVGEELTLRESIHCFNQQLESNIAIHLHKACWLLTSQL